MAITAEIMPKKYEKIHVCYGSQIKLTISFDNNEKELNWRCNICGSNYCFENPNKIPETVEIKSQEIKDKRSYMDGHQWDRIGDLMDNR
jgi:hypothetical protein